MKSKLTYTCIDKVFIQSQDSYSLCRIFKKTIQIPAKPSKEEEQAEDAKKESMWISEEQMLGEDSSGTEFSREMETVEEKILNHEYPKFPCDASSSDLTQGTCTPTDTGIAEDFQPHFACDEANSATNSYTMGIGYASNLFQVTFKSNLKFRTLTHFMIVRVCIITSHVDVA